MRLIAVIIWKAKRIFEFTPNLSSIRPTIARGNEINGANWSKNKDEKTEINTKTIPPPLGFIFVWELLILGLSGIFFLKNGKNIKINT